MSTSSAQPIPAEERQVNLLLALRNTTTGLTAATIIATVAGYDPAGGTAARRMFERDKSVLRGLGITVQTSGSEEQTRYRVAEEDYALPELTVSASQAAAIDLAASAWRSGALTSSARHALTKIRAVADRPHGPGALLDLTLDLAGDEVPAELAAAVDERRLVSFDYLSPASGRSRSRTVEAHRLRLSQGAWYLDALEPATGSRRTFRLARITGGVDIVSGPGAFDPDPPDPETHTALLAVAPGRALQIRAGATSAPPPAGVEPPEGWEVLSAAYADTFAFAGALAALGDGVVVLAPPALREEVLAHLRGAAALTGCGRDGGR
ncbi:MAG: WYL domain-containing protein [Actinomyces sp.]|uniref:helix-turn-helix transcriptional regulator n=1 Tax=Actinomyces sp. TaxID=29317 RepID=UPI0026DB862F|nr:WYL domain-containing protein [Actinomyces sp.]MDO4243305.1 WYL domain-containing protein [Actinomyces sp.]